MSENVKLLNKHSGFCARLLKDTINEPVEDNKGFTDPVLRCDSCNKIVLRGTITALGLCNHCGNKRFRPVDVIGELELMQIKKLDGAEAFLELFEEVPNEK